jgi:hypothetical protein
MIEFPCPRCGVGLSVEDEMAFRKGKCPGCGQMIRAPAAPPTFDWSPLPTRRPRGRFGGDGRPQKPKED